MEEPLVTLASRVRTERPQGPQLWPYILLVIALMIAAVITLGTGRGIPVATESPSTSGTPEREPHIYTVTYRFGVFSPTNLRIHQGDTVRWHNTSSSGVRVVAQLQPAGHAPEFDSIGAIPPDGYFAYTFARVGVFSYINADDSGEMGSIIVRE